MDIYFVWELCLEAMGWFPQNLQKYWGTWLILVQRDQSTLGAGSRLMLIQEIHGLQAWKSQDLLKVIIATYTLFQEYMLLYVTCLDHLKQTIVVDPFIFHY